MLPIATLSLPYQQVYSCSELFIYYVLACLFKLINYGVQAYAAYTNTYNNRQRNIIHEFQYDCKYLEYIYGDLHQLLLSEPIQSNDIISYYTNTTLRDYQLMDYYTNSTGGMHTLLKQPALCDIGTLHQAASILPAINMCSSNATSTRHGGGSTGITRVLELGSGKGINTQFIASNTNKNVHCIGIDLTELHTKLATSSAKQNNITNCTFYTADYTKLNDIEYITAHTDIPSELMQPNTYDVIYSIESMCYINQPEQQLSLLSHITTLLKPNGTLIIIDGYRSDNFDSCNRYAQLAMRLAEFGYRCTSMPSKQQWITAASHTSNSSSSQLLLYDSIDLTDRALPFWQEGRIGVRFLLYFWPLLRIIKSYIGDTAYNYLSMATTAYSMELGSAEYGQLVFKKSNTGTHCNGTSNGVTH